ncbi:MAG: hypothetical protein RL595_3347 [Planctomycetota bacterium]|jgi:hypothetical protein
MNQENKLYSFAKDCVNATKGDKEVKERQKNSNNWMEVEKSLTKLYEAISLVLSYITFWLEA